MMIQRRRWGYCLISSTTSPRLLMMVLALSSSLSLLSSAPVVDGFLTTSPCSTLSSSSSSTTPLHASAGKKKRRRRRPTPSTTAEEDPVRDNKIARGVDREDDDDDEDDDAVVEMRSEREELKVDGETTPGFEFQPPTADPPIAPNSDSSPPSPVDNNNQEGTLPLPDIRDQLKRKELQEKIAKMEAEQEETKVKIKRSDKDAYNKLLESQPFADADDSYFEEEAYNTVSALLGERAKPFLGIPTGPLQVGHFIGALGIMLMAFVEYPGFPLTNLPTPIRDALAGGLGTVYSINLVLAAVSVGKAQERGQPVPLWVTKTLTVGGLAYDQLTQLPTTAELERVASVKGARAVKNRKKN